MLFMLNINELVINYINLNDQINKQIICVLSYYPITNLVMFEFINFDIIIIRIRFGLTNII